MASSMCAPVMCFGIMAVSTKCYSRVPPQAIAPGRSALCSAVLSISVLRVIVGRRSIEAAHGLERQCKAGTEMFGSLRPQRQPVGDDPKLENPQPHVPCQIGPTRSSSEPLSQATQPSNGGGGSLGWAGRHGCRRRSRRSSVVPGTAAGNRGSRVGSRPGFSVYGRERQRTLVAVSSVPAVAISSPLVVHRNRFRQSHGPESPRSR